MGLSYLQHATSNITYFTYFSEFNRHCTQAYIWESLILGIFFLVAFIGNILVISFVIRFQYMRQVTNYYITNLAISDLIFSLTTPLVIATRTTQEWVLTNGVCHVMVYTMYVCGITSVWTMVFISIDRYRSIVKFDRDKSKFGTIFMRMGIVWLAAISFSLPIGVFFKELTLKLPDGTDVQVCTLDWQRQTSTIIFCILNFIFVFCIPLVCIVRNYHQIMTTFNRSRRRMQEHSHSTPQGAIAPQPASNRRFSRSISSSLRSNATAREIKVMTMLILIVSMFAIMWCPIIMIQFFLIMDWLHLQSWHFILTLGITYLNVALNPIVYGLLNEQYKKQFLYFFQRIRCSCCKCKMCTVNDSIDMDMEDVISRERTPVVTVCARGLEVAGDVALRSNGLAFDQNFENPVYMRNEMKNNNINSL